MSKQTTARIKYNPQLGRLPTLQFLRPGEIRVDPAYQRSLEAHASQSLIRRMAQHWNWDLCQPLTIARRIDLTERFFVIDGQHRLEAAKLRGDIDQLPCVIVNYANPADEAASFVHLNQQRRPLTKLDLFKAAIASGDSEACAIANAISAAGLTIAPHSNHAHWKPGALSNIGGIETAWRRQGGEVTSVALGILAEGFRTQVLRYAGTIFPGIVAVCADEMAAAAPAAGRLHSLVEMLARRSQDDWRNDIMQAKTNSPELKFGDASAVALRRAWNGNQPAISGPPSPPEPAAPLVEHCSVAIANAPRPHPIPAKPQPVKFDAAGKAWCTQCEDRVTRAAATFCKSRFCAVRAFT